MTIINDNDKSNNYNKKKKKKKQKNSNNNQIQNTDHKFSFSHHTQIQQPFLVIYFQCTQWDIYDIINYTESYTPVKWYICQTKKYDTSRPSIYPVYTHSLLSDTFSDTEILPW